MASKQALLVDVETMGLANRGGWARPMARPHRHNEVELNFVEVGSMTYLFGGRREKVSYGELAFFWAALPHQTVEVSEGTIFYWLTIPFATFLQWRLPEALVQQVIRGKFVRGAGESAGQKIAAHVARFQQWQEDLRSGGEEHHKIVLLEVEACLRRLALIQHEEPESPAGERLALHAVSKGEQMACFIAEHYTEPLSVEDVAEVVHLHPHYAMSLFRKCFGISIVEYITHYRIAHAQRLLITTDENVSAIALEAGFGSVSRFYSVFKAACGQLPGEYRGSLQG